MDKKRLVYTLSILVVSIGAILLTLFIKNTYAVDPDLSNLTETNSATVEIGGIAYTVNNKNDTDNLLKLKRAIDNYRQTNLNTYHKIHEQAVGFLIENAESIQKENIATTVYYYSGKFYTDSAHSQLLYKTGTTQYSNMQDLLNNATEDMVVSLLTEYRVASTESWEPNVNIILFRGDQDGKRFLEVNVNQTLTMKPTENGSLTIDGYRERIQTSYTPMRAGTGSTINIYDRVIIKDFYCTTNGGVMYLDGGTINIYGGIFYNNKAGATGGFISCNNGTFNVTDGIFANNTSGSGGGVFVIKYPSNIGTANFTGGVFVNNSSSGQGGTIRLESGTVQLSNTVIYNNSTSSEGGVVYMKGGSLTISNSLIYDNQSTSQGGAIYMTAGNFHMTSGYIGIEKDDSNTERANKTTSSSGGGIYVNGGNVLMEGGYISSNEALNGNGGGLYVTGGTFTMNNGTISSNDSQNGGGAYINGGNVTINNGVIENNNATIDGGGLYANSTQTIEIDVLGGTITNNNAGNRGGGIGINITSSTPSRLNVGGTSLTDIGINPLEISNNEAPTSGGGMYVNGNVVVNIYNGSIKKNITSGIGAGLSVSENGEVFVNGGIIEENESIGHGAGVNIGTNGKFSMYGGEIKGNISSAGSGGGVYLNSGNYSMENGTISFNKAIDGAGAYVQSAQFILTGGKFANNEAKENGGGFFIGDGSTVNLSDGIINNNKAINGGGFYQTKDSNETTTNISGNCIINANQAIHGNGAGVYIDGGSTFRMIGGKITYNTASLTAPLKTDTLAKDSEAGVGGGVYILNGTFTMYDESGNPGTAAIFGNTADYAADDLFSSGTNTSFDAIAVADMVKDGEYKTADYWFEDFPQDESHITLNKNNREDSNPNNDTIVSYDRYKNIEDADKKAVATTVLYRNCKDYIAITMGNSIGTINISVEDTENSIAAHSYIYKIESCDADNCNINNPDVSLKVVVQKDKPVQITNLATGYYRISIVPNWSWRYDETIKYTIIENSKTRTKNNKYVDVIVYTEQTTEVKTDYTMNNKLYLSKTDITEK